MGKLLFRCELSTSHSPFVITALFFSLPIQVLNDLVSLGLGRTATFVSSGNKLPVSTINCHLNVTYSNKVIKLVNITIRS